MRVTICSYIIQNAPVLRSEVCAALGTTKHQVNNRLVNFARESETSPFIIVAVHEGKDMRYTVKPSPFALAQHFIRSRKHGNTTKSKAINAGTSTATTAQR